MGKCLNREQSGLRPQVRVACDKLGDWRKSQTESLAKEAAARRAAAEEAKEARQRELQALGRMSKGRPSAPGPSPTRSERKEIQPEKSPAKRGVGEVSEGNQPREPKAKKTEDTAKEKSVKVVSLSPDSDHESCATVSSQKTV